MVQYKIISGKKYYLYDKYYNKGDAYKKAMEIKQKVESENKKLRYFIEEAFIFGDLDELFIPGNKYFLWIRS